MTKLVFDPLCEDVAIVREGMYLGQLMRREADWYASSYSCNFSADELRQIADKVDELNTINPKL